MSKCQRGCKRELGRVLCMQGGDGDLSYARNSEAAALAVVLSKPLLVEAITWMPLFPDEATIRVADLGCATGYNTLSTVELVVTRLRRRYEENGSFVPEFQAFFSDLPSNDFNSLFRSLASFAGEKKASASFFAAGVPGSFYGRLFPKDKLHFVISLSAMHWLSKIPEQVLDRNSKAWNGGKAWIDGANEGVVDAYAKQSSDDLLAFVQSRKMEIVEGGVLFLLMAGRPGSQSPENQLGDPVSRIKHPFTSFMDQAWSDLVNEGLIDEETKERFNIPAFMRSTEEVRRGFEECGGFEIRRLEYKKIAEHTREEQEGWIREPKAYGKARANLVRATLRPLVEEHLGKPEMAEELFSRFEKRVSENTEMICQASFYGVILVWAIRRS